MIIVQLQGWEYVSILICFILLVILNAYQSHRIRQVLKDVRTGNKDQQEIKTRLHYLRERGEKISRKLDHPMIKIYKGFKIVKRLRN